MPQSHLTIASFAGSLRKESISRRLLRASMHLTSSNMSIMELDIAEIPMFNADLEIDGPPKVVSDLKKSVSASDGLLIVTPEYNHGIPAVTKNVIDWLSRKNDNIGNVLSNLPVDIIAISGNSGNLVITQIRQVLVYPGAIPMPNGDVGLPGRQLEFNEAEQLTESIFIDQIQKNLDQFTSWINKLSV